jgi:vacuolar-type H+-ATPase subunit F/Vma7
MENDPDKIKDAASAEDKPFVIVIPKDFSGEEGQEKKILKDAGLWSL